MRSIIFNIICIILLCTTLLVTTTTAQERRGKCVEWLKYSPQTNVMTDLIRPICYPSLASAYTHVWADQQVIDATSDPENPVCQRNAQMLLSSFPSRVSAIFGDDMPSAMCQKTLIAAICVYANPRCDPNIDVDVFITDQKPCKWLCDMLHDETAGVCSAADKAYLKENGFDIEVMMPCTGPNPGSVEWSDDKATCNAPLAVQNFRPAARCVRYTGKVCTGVFHDSYMAYISAEHSQEEVERMLESRLYEYNAFGVDSECAKASLKNVCTAVFPECVEKGLKRAELQSDGTYKPVATAARPLKLTPPVEVCNQHRESCRPTPFYQYLIATGWESYSFPNCTTATTPSTLPCLQGTNNRRYLSKYEYSRHTFETPVSSLVITGQTFAASDIPFISSVPYTDECPWPLVIPRDNSPSPRVYDGRCAVQCPTPTYTDDERTALLAVTDVLCIVAMCFTGVLALSFIVFRSQRNKTIIFWYTISYFMIPFIIFIGMRVNGRYSEIYQNQCIDQTELYHMTGFPLFQSIVLVYFILASSAWWCGQSVDLFLRLIFARQYKRHSWSYNRRSLAMHLFCWGTPALCVIPLAIAGQLGYDGYLPFSFIHTDHNVTSKPIDLYWPFFFIPLLMYTLTGFTLIGIIVYYLITYDHESQSPSQQNQEMDKATKKITEHKNLYFKIQQTLKLCGFLSLMVFFLLVMIIHLINQGLYGSNWEASVQRWATCALVSAYDGADCKWDDRLDPNRVILTLVGIVSPAFLQFLLYFVGSVELYQLWLGVFYFQCGFKCFERCARRDEDTGTGGSSSSASSKGKSTGSTDLLTGDAVLVQQNDSVMTDPTVGNDNNTVGDGDKTDGGGDDTDTNASITKKSEKNRKMSKNTSHRGSTDLPYNNHAYPAAGGGTTHRRKVPTKDTRRNQMFKGFKSNQWREPTKVDYSSTGTFNPQHYSQTRQSLLPAEEKGTGTGTGAGTGAGGASAGGASAAGGSNSVTDQPPRVSDPVVQNKGVIPPNPTTGPPTVDAQGNIELTSLIGKGPRTTEPIQLPPAKTKHNASNKYHQDYDDEGHLIEIQEEHNTGEEVF